MNAASMRLLVLGAAAGGGLPQWNCRCPVCTLARAGDPRVKPRTQCSLAVSADGGEWLLVNASPDLRRQVLTAPALAPQEGPRSTPISAVILTNGEVDAVAGLLTMRESQPFRLYATEAIHARIEANPIFRVLDPGMVQRRLLVPGEPVAIAGLSVTPLAVPGKVPLYAEGDLLEEDAIGLSISHGDRRCVIIPNCARITPDLVRQIDGADLLLFDGTTFHDDEMIRLGLSQKTAARMGHVAMAGEAGSLASLAGVPVGRRVYIHINNSNPALVEGSPEHRQVLAAGWSLAEDGMELEP